MQLTADLSDDSLLKLIRNDDKAAFSEIYQRYAVSLADFCASRLHQVEEGAIQIFAKVMWSEVETSSK